MPKSLVESTRSMWPVVVLMSGRFAVIEGGCHTHRQYIV